MTVSKKNRNTVTESTATVTESTAPQTVVVPMHPLSIAPQEVIDTLGPTLAAYADLAGLALTADDGTPLETDAQWMHVTNVTPASEATKPVIVAFGPFKYRRGMKQTLQDALHAIAPSFSYEVTPASGIGKAGSNYEKFHANATRCRRRMEAMAEPPGLPVVK